MSTAPVPAAAPLLQERLDNGLRVVVREDHTAPAVAVNLWYGVGSRHELPGRTGLAHLFEHLMFQGSAHVHSGEHFGLLEPLGASLNATTSFDRTNYFETVPTGALDLALWLEADRMGGLLAALDQPNLDNQRDVVKNERRQTHDNRPYGTAWERLFALTFPPDNAYHHLPIGSMADLDAASLDDVRAFFTEHYSPVNAVLTMVGDVTAAAAVAAAARWFGGIDGGSVPRAPVAPTLSPLTEARLEVVAEDVPAAASYQMWRLPPDPAAAVDAAAVALRVLGDGPSSRLQVRLVRREERAASVGAGVERLVGGSSTGLVIVRARPGESVELMEDAVVEELERLAADGPTDRELAQARAGVEREYLEETASLAGQANELSHHACLFGDAALADGVVDRLAAVTAEQVTELTRTWLRADARATVRFLPGAPAGPATGAPAGAPADPAASAVAA